MIRSHIAKYLVEGFVRAFISAREQRTGLYLFPSQLWEQLQESVLVNPTSQLYMALGDITSSMTDQQTKDAKHLFDEIMQEVRYKFSPLVGDGVIRWLSTQHIDFAPGTVVGGKDGFKGYAKFLAKHTREWTSNFGSLPILLLFPDPYVPPSIRFGINLTANNARAFADHGLRKELTAYRKLLKEAIHNYVDRYFDRMEHDTQVSSSPRFLARKLEKKLSPFAKTAKEQNRYVIGGTKYETVKPPLGMSQSEYFSRKGQIRIMKSAPIKTIKSALKLPSSGVLHWSLAGAVPFHKMDDPKYPLESFIPAMAIGNTLLNSQKEYAKKVLKDKLDKESKK